MRRIRVLHIITRLIVGGAQENTVLTVEGLAQQKEYEVSLLIGFDGGPEGDLAEDARARGIHVIVIPEMIRSLHPVKDLIALFKIYQVIARGKYDVVHTHSTKAGLLGRLAARMARTPVVVHTLHSLVFHPFQPAWLNFGLRIMKRWLSRYTDHFIAVADAVKLGALRAGIGTPEKYSTMYSGMNLEMFRNHKSNREAVREAIGIPSDVPVLGKIARLFHNKGHMELLSSLPDVIRAVPQTRVLLVGDGPLKEALCQRARQLGVSDNLVFTGLVRPERIPDLISAMDVVVHTSLREGLARVIPQALAMGKPVVAWELDGTPEIVKHGEVGYLAQPGDTEGLAKALIDLLVDRKKAEAMGAKGPSVVDPRFRKELMVERIDRLYKELLERKGYEEFTESAGSRLGRSARGNFVEGT
jgi:glycosyltransferase involved in cell wall biosynthesis